MKNKGMNKLIAFALFFLMSGAMMAQTSKVGYINTDAVIQLLPSYKAANTQFETFAETVVTPEIKTKTEQYQTKLKQLNDEAANMGDARREVAAAELMTLEKEINVLHQENNTQQKLSVKEQELFQPIQEEASNLISEVAKANGFSIVLEVRSGIVYADENTNLLPLVKAKLGVTE